MQSDIYTEKPLPLIFILDVLPVSKSQVRAINFYENQAQGGSRTSIQTAGPITRVVAKRLQGLQLFFQESLKIPYFEIPEKIK